MGSWVQIIRAIAKEVSGKSKANPVARAFVGIECWFREALSLIQRKDVCPLLGFEGQFCAWGTFGESPRDPNPPLKGAFLACMGGYPKHPSRGTLISISTFIWRVDVITRFDHARR